MDTKTRPLTRKQLGEWLPNPRSIITVENLLSDVGDQGTVLSTAPFIVTEADPNLNDARVLTDSPNIAFADDPVVHTLTLDLTNTGVVADTYGEPTRILVLAIDAKGRISSAQEIKMDVSDVDGVLAVAHGGTGFISYTVGDLVYADTPTTFAKLPDVATGNVLKAGGVGAAPAYGKVVLTTDVTGVLPAANGGFPSGGFSGTVSPVVSITVVNGLVTAVS